MHKTQSDPSLSRWAAKFISIFVVTAAVLMSAPGRAQDVLNVSSVAGLESALSSANQSGGNTTILLADGVYTLDRGLQITAPGITLAGSSRAAERVVIEGDAMSSTAKVGNVVTVSAPDFTLEHVTLRKSRNHLIQIRGEVDADRPTIRNCILRDSYEQLLKVSVNLSDTSVSSDDGLVENCLFEYTAGIGPQWYIGGIDAHSSRNWVVRSNIFRGIVSPSEAVAQYAIHFWNDSANNLVDGNLIVNCDRGIGFGLGSRRNEGGIIRNNMIYHAANLGAFADVAIAIHNSPDTSIYNNTVFMEHAYPSAIEYRFPDTTGVLIANNLTNKGIRSRDGATAEVAMNMIDATADWFRDPDQGDLHLASALPAVVDAGRPIPGLTRDFDGDTRPAGSGVDIGADELVDQRSVPKPPSEFRAQ